MTDGEQFIAIAKRRFNDYKALGEKAIEQLHPNQLFVPHKDDTVNSIAIIIQHLHGNMLSRWTNFMMEDGEKKWRKRDEEFESPTSKDKSGLMQKWHEGWKCLFDALDSMKPQDLKETIYIRNEGLSVMDAVMRQMMHYAYHVGQIITMAKQMKSGDWKSLSIPKKKA